MQEAYDARDAIDELTRSPTARMPTLDELKMAELKAAIAETELRQFGQFIEGPRRRFWISGTELDE